MKISDVLNVIKSRASELAGAAVSVGIPGPSEGITVAVVTGPTSEAFYNRAENRTVGLTFHVKSSDQLQAADLCQLIGDGLTRWNYPTNEESFRIKNIKHGGAFFIAQEESTKHWIYGVSVDISLYY